MIDQDPFRQGRRDFMRNVGAASLAVALGDAAKDAVRQPVSQPRTLQDIPFVKDIEERVDGEFVSPDVFVQKGVLDIFEKNQSQISFDKLTGSVKIFGMNGELRGEYEVDQTAKPEAVSALVTSFGRELTFTYKYPDGAKQLFLARGLLDGDFVVQTGEYRDSYSDSYVIDDRPVDEQPKEK